MQFMSPEHGALDGRSESLTQRCREPSSNEAPGRFGFEMQMNWKGSTSGLVTKRCIQLRIAAPLVRVRLNSYE